MTVGLSAVTTILDHIVVVNVVVNRAVDGCCKSLTWDNAAP